MDALLKLPARANRGATLPAPQPFRLPAGSLSQSRQKTAMAH